MKKSFVYHTLFHIQWFTVQRNPFRWFSIIGLDNIVDDWSPWPRLPCVSGQTYTHAHTHTHTNAHTHTHIFTHTRTHSHVYTRVLTYSNTRIHIYTCIHTLTYTHRHTRIYIHTLSTILRIPRLLEPIHRLGPWITRSYTAHITQTMGYKYIYIYILPYLEYIIIHTYLHTPT